MANKKDWLALALLKGMGGASFRRLLEQFPNPADIFKVSAAELKKAAPYSRAPFEFLNDELYRSSVTFEMKLAEDQGVRLVTWEDEEYPSQLKQIYDPPVLLFAKGALRLNDAFSIAVVGSRKCSFYGQKMAKAISQELCEAGVTVTSGLASGIDSFAHMGALAGGGRTIAVLGSGLGHIYPEKNKTLAKEIEMNGVIVSEYPMRMGPMKENFPQRNRIISGLSRGVLVVEAREKSGALITADTALEQGRDIFVLPGAADSAGFMGSHSLIKDGAIFVTSAADILNELGIEPTGCVEAISEKRSRLTGTENRIVSFLNSSPVHVDDIIEGSGLNAREAGSALSLLEMKGRVRRLPGNHFVRIS